MPFQTIDPAQVGCGVDLPANLAVMCVPVVVVHPPPMAAVHREVVQELSHR
jgi:hypothetical protein